LASSQDGWNQGSTEPSWTLFVLVASLAFVFLFALAASAHQPAQLVATPTQEPFVPAVLRDDDSADWIQNGSFSRVRRVEQGIAVEGWHLFDVTGSGARFEHNDGDSFVSLVCPGPCIAGLYQRLQDLPPGEYQLDSYVYLEGSDPTGVLAARVGFDETGAVDATALTAKWSEPARGQGWQRSHLSVWHEGGPATVFVIFDRLLPEADCRLASVRMLGPPMAAESIATATPVPTATVDQAGTEWRALCIGVDDLEWSGPAEIRAAISRAAEAHFNAICFQVRHLGFAYYDSGIEPLSPAIAEPAGGGPRWDPLAEAVRAAHASGLETYAWVELLPVWEGERALASSVPGHMFNLFSMRYGEDWLQWRGGEPGTDENGWLYASPAHPAVREYLVSLCSDLVARYDVDGLHLSHVRYVGADSSHDPASMTAYLGEAEKTIGLEYADWQRATLTGLVQRISEAVREVRPGIKVSASAWPVYKDQWGWNVVEGYDDLYQDGKAWLAEKCLDALMPSLYVEPEFQWPQRLSVTVADYVEGAGEGAIVPVLSAKTSSFAALARAIERSRQAGASGVAILGYRDLEERGYWEKLLSGPFAPVVLSAAR